jgi:hypothetical protein
MRGRTNARVRKAEAPTAGLHEDKPGWRGDVRHKMECGQDLQHIGKHEAMMAWSEPHLT